jgi:choline dehydrogenase-like flavoprotein
MARHLHPEPLGHSHRHGLSQGLDDLKRRFDVCVIGSGAAGGVAVDTFVRAGFDVLLLEEGPRLAPATSNEALDASCPTAIARDARGEWGERGWPWTTRNLGGGTVYYGGASFRYLPFDFDPSSHIVVDDLDVRWPISLDDLAPCYDEIERRLGVHSAAVGPWPRDAAPPATLSLPAEYLWRGARALGYMPEPTPLAIDRGLCDNCSLCICTQCASGAKRDAVSAFIEPLAGCAHLTIRTGARAVALRQSRPHDADELLCVDIGTGVEHVIRARLFVLACNAIQSAALLLRSTTTLQPTGIGNRYDLVGRGLSLKASEYSLGEVDCFTDEICAHPIGYRGPFSTVSLLDRYLDEDCPTGVGGLMYEAKPDDWRVVDRRSRLLLRIETIISDHPSAKNRVRLAPERDQWGIPKIVIDYTPDKRDIARLEYMLGKSAQWLEASGVDKIYRERSNYMLGSTHLHGTCRAGDDPKISVLDRNGRIHGMDNVFVIDGSYMPYPGGLNPTLTIQANALRMARHIVAAQGATPYPLLASVCEKGRLPDAADRLKVKRTSGSAAQ